MAKSLLGSFKLTCVGLAGRLALIRYFETENCKKEVLKKSGLFVDWRTESLSDVERVTGLVDGDRYDNLGVSCDFDKQTTLTGRSASDGCAC